MGKERLRKAMLRRRIAAALHKRSKAANPNEYYRLRYRNDPTFMLWERHRNQFKKWMNGEKRTNTMARIVGYSREDLRQHIERQFDSGMSWENYGDWHIDHIVPKNLFDPANENHVRRCWALDNLRPLWASENCARPHDGSDVRFSVIAAQVGFKVLR